MVAEMHNAINWYYVFLMMAAGLQNRSDSTTKKSLQIYMRSSLGGHWALKCALFTYTCITIDQTMSTWHLHVAS